MLYDKRWELDEVGKQIMSAADYMESHGWCRDIFDNPEGAVCIMGALFAASAAPVISVHYSSHRIRNSLGCSITWWNDNICQSKEQAVATLRAAAFCAGK